MRIIIDGNIGSGKTTQLELLRQVGWSVKCEPIEKWPLDLFYKDMSRWAFLLQMRILQTIQASKEGVHIYERGLLGTRHVFWEYLRKKNYVTNEEHIAYENAYEKYAWYPDLYIYLSKTPETAFEHIKTRNQPGDTKITLEYLKELNTLYNSMIKNVPCKVYVVNANKTPEKIHEEIISILKTNVVLERDARRKKVSSSGSHGREVLCTPYTDMCRLS
jgi:deoxyadenosine/deoxycytidine kinase